jgi:endonuclease/exonuclease/phosphatase family metal-dependent hydrolase
LKTVNVLSYNIHKGFNPTGREFVLGEMRDAIRQVDPDIVFLQEVRGGQFEHLAEEIWPHFTYGKNVVHATTHHGNAILSRFPILSWENISILKTRFESRGLLHSILDVDGLRLHAFCTHFGLLEGGRKKQAGLLDQRIREHSKPGEPLIVAGDFNDWRGRLGKSAFDRIGLEEAFLSIQGAHARTFPAWLPALRLDRIYYQGFRATRATCHTAAPWNRLSDHAAISAELQLL